MPWIKHNPNPAHKETIDCVVRAISVAEGISWDEAFKALTEQAYREKDMPSYNPTWANYLRDRGYELYGLPNTCPRCYTVADFSYDHPNGTYVLGTGSHAIAVIDGNYIDTWDSGNEVPMYFFKKGDNNNEFPEPVRTEQSTSNTTDPTANKLSAAGTMPVQPNPGSVGTGGGGSQGIPVNLP